MHEKSASPSSCWSTSSTGGAKEAVEELEQESRAPGMETSYWGGGVRETTGRGAGVRADGYRGNDLLEGGDNTLTTEDASSATACEGVGSGRGATCGGDGPRDGTATTVEVYPRRMSEEERDVRRSRLQDLGQLLVRKRQFAASRQVRRPVLRCFGMLVAKNRLTGEFSWVLTRPDNNSTVLRRQR